MKRYILGISLFLIGAFVSSPAHAAPDLVGHFLDTSWQGLDAASGYTSLEVDITVEEDPGESAAYYFSNTVFFTNYTGSNTGVAYAGLQTNGYDGSQWIGKMAIFSVWDTFSGIAEPQGTGVEFGGEGTGYSVRIPYNWLEGRTYQLKIYLDSTVGANNIWAASLTDMTTLIETRIGRIDVEAGRGNILTPITFNERYGGGSDACDDLEPVRVRFGNMTANNGTVEASSWNHYFVHDIPECPNYNWTADTREDFISATGPPTLPDNIVVRLAGDNFNEYVVRGDVRHRIPDTGTLHRFATQETILELDTEIFALFPEGYKLIKEGAVIRANNHHDVWIIRYANGKQFKRLVLSPTVFDSYGHLRWEDVLVINPEAVNAFTTSDLVQSNVDERIYQLVPSGDSGTRHWIVSDAAFTTRGFDYDAVYRINLTDENSYVEGGSLG